MFENFLRKIVKGMDHLQKKDKTESARGLGRKRGDRKRESNDSPETPDREGISDIPGLPLWENKAKIKPTRTKCTVYTQTGNWALK